MLPKYSEFQMLITQKAAAVLACCTVYFALLPFGMAQNTQSAVTQKAVMRGPDLDLSIYHYSRVVTPEGVIRESRYEEWMLRRVGHVWRARVLPDSSSTAKESGHQGHARASYGKSMPDHQSKLQPADDEHAHKHFNPVLLPRHITFEADRVRLEFVDTHNREIVSILPSEYENVNFDGSWENAYFLLDPQIAAALPASKRKSPVASARWREREKNGIFQRVLWDDQKMIPLIIESGDLARNFFKKIEIRPHATLTKHLPWHDTKRFAHKEYTDFLD